MSLICSIADDWWIGLFVVAFAVLIYIYPFGKSRVVSKRSKSCTSDHCVRCNNYDVVLSEAITRFRLFKVSNGDIGLERISAFFEDQEGLFATPLQKPNVLYVPGLRALPVWTNHDAFSREWKLLERHWLEIFDEFKAVYSHLKNDSSCWIQNTTEEGQWLVFCLYNQGKKIAKNCSLCPKTSSIIESMSTFMRCNVFGNAMFSVLQPGTLVAEHYGPCNIRIRGHLGLAIPASESKITVGGQSCMWHNGCCLFIDDSFSHGAEYKGSEMDGPRVVLIVDLWHPDLTMKERSAINAIFPSSN